MVDGCTEFLSKGLVEVRIPEWGAVWKGVGWRAGEGAPISGWGAWDFFPLLCREGEGSTAGIAKEGEAPRKSGDGGGDLVHLRVVDDGEGRRGYICRGGVVLVTQVTSDTLPCDRAVVDDAARASGGWEGAVVLILRLRWQGSF